MTIPLTIGMWFLAALPIVVLLYLMVRRQWGANKAAPVGLMIALVIGLVFYRANVRLIGYEILKGLWSSFGVLFVVWPAILLYEIVSEAKALTVVRQGLKKMTPNELLQILAIGWVFTSFLQGITGFGVPVAVGAPLLLGLGVHPIYAVLIPLLGHAWAGTFGTLAVAWDALLLQTGLTGEHEVVLSSALWASIFIWIFNFLSGLMIAWLYGKKEGIKKGLLAVVLISTILGGGQLIVSQLHSTLAAFLPATIAMAAIFILSRMKIYQRPWKIESSPVMNRHLISDEPQEDQVSMTFHQAFFPYIVLTIMTLVILLIPPVQSFFSEWKIGFSFPETKTGYGYMNPAETKFSPIALFTHAGFFLLLSAMIGFFYYRKKGWLGKKSHRKILSRSWRKTVPAGTAFIGFIVMSRIMGGTGQTLILARGIGDLLGEYYIAFSPFVGVLGSFITNSNMSSNILFGEFQLTMATILGLQAAPILGAHTAGGAIGITISPGNLILGTTTAGNIGSEGEILKKIFPIVFVSALIVGLIVFVTLIL